MILRQPPEPRVPGQVHALRQHPLKPTGLGLDPRRQAVTNAISFAQVESATTEITVSDPGKARIFVKNPPVTVNCYGADVITNSIFNCVG